MKSFYRVSLKHQNSLGNLEEFNPIHTVESLPTAILIHIRDKDWLHAVTCYEQSDEVIVTLPFLILKGLVS